MSLLQHNKLTCTDVSIVEMGARDGLQNEAADVPAIIKAGLVDRLAASGVRRIEVGSFVSPRWVPQMADSAEVFAGITRSISSAALSLQCSSTITPLLAPAIT